MPPENRGRQNAKQKNNSAKAPQRESDFYARRPAQELNARAPAASATIAEVAEKKLPKIQIFFWQPQCPPESRGRQNAKRKNNSAKVPQRESDFYAHRPAQELNARAPAASAPLRLKARERNFASPAAISRLPLFAAPREVERQIRARLRPNRQPATRRTS